MNRSTKHRAKRGSVLLIVTIFSTIIALAVTSLVGFGIQRRNESARLVIYNAELGAAESALHTLISQADFVGQRYPPQVTYKGSGMSDFIQGELSTPNIPGFDVDAAIEEVMAEQVAQVDDDLIAILGPDFAQWRGFPIRLSSYRIHTGARANANSGLALLNRFERPGVYLSQVVTLYQIPLLNYAIFYGNDLELDAGARIDVVGKVHTNGDWYLTTSSSAYYHDNCTIAGNFYGGIYHPGDGARRTWSGSTDINITDRGPSDPGADASSFEKLKQNSIPINNGYLSSVNYNSKPADPTKWTVNPNWVDKSMDMFDGFLRDSAHGIGQIELPISDTDTPHLLIEPPKATDGFTETSQKFAYQAAVIFETLPGWTGATSDKDLLNYVRAYRMVEDASSPTGYTQSAVDFSLGYRRPGDSSSTVRTFVSHKKIYNGREERYINMLDIDIGKMAEYLDSTSMITDATKLKLNLDNPRYGVDDGVIYVNTPQETASTDKVGGTWKQSQTAVRISNAKDFKPLRQNSGMAANNGITIATEAPFYTKGDVNAFSDASQRVPLLLAGDSMNILSNAFNDSQYGVANLSGDGPKKSASTTTTNAVFLTGNVPTRTNQYSGGGENYFRYLEGWGTHNFKGSMLNLLESQIATTPWDKNTGTGTSSGYYGAPRRVWKWDESFASGSVPPGMPNGHMVSVAHWTLSDRETYIAVGGEDLAYQPGG